MVRAFAETSRLKTKTDVDGFILFEWSSGTRSITMRSLEATGSQHWHKLITLVAGSIRLCDGVDSKNFIWTFRHGQLVFILRSGNGNLESKLLLLDLHRAHTCFATRFQLNSPWDRPKSKTCDHAVVGTCDLMDVAVEVDMLLSRPWTTFPQTHRPKQLIIATADQQFTNIQAVWASAPPSNAQGRTRRNHLTIPMNSILRTTIGRR